jgi:hypothetical protein
MNDGVIILVTRIVSASNTVVGRRCRSGITAVRALIAGFRTVAESTVIAIPGRSSADAGRASITHRAECAVITGGSIRLGRIITDTGARIAGTGIVTLI